MFLTIKVVPSALVEKRRNFQAASRFAGSRAVNMPAAPPVGRRPFTGSTTGSSAVCISKFRPTLVIIFRRKAVEPKRMPSLPAAKACSAVVPFSCGIPPSVTIRRSKRKLARPSAPAKPTSRSSGVSMRAPWLNSSAENIQSSPGHWNHMPSVPSPSALMRAESAIASSQVFGKASGAGLAPTRRRSSAL